MASVTFIVSVIFSLGAGAGRLKPVGRSMDAEAPITALVTVTMLLKPTPYPLRAATWRVA